MDAEFICQLASISYGWPASSKTWSVTHGFAAVYIYDGHELDNRKHLDVAKDLQCGTVKRLQCMLHSYNPSVQCFKAMNMAEFEPNVDIVLHAGGGMYFNASICILDPI